MKTLDRPGKSELCAFALLLCALLLRVSWFGAEYYLQLDDYIHYRNLAPGTDPVSLCIQNGLFSSRPLAALQDLVFWGRIPLFAGTVLLSVMYAAAGVLFWRLFKRYFGTGICFLVIFCLFPLGFEGTYWHAAATRILPPMFFTAAAVTALDRFVRTRNYWLLIPYLVCSLLSFCFYEQMLVLSLALSLMLVLMYLLERKWHGLWGLTILLCVVVYVLVTGYFSGLAQGQLSGRMNIILPTDPTYFSNHLPSLATQLHACFVTGTRLILGRGTLRGAELIFRSAIWAAVLIPILVGLVFWFGRCGSEDRSHRLRHLAPLFGLLAALAPVTPFFIIAKPWVCLRSTVPSFLGLALLADYLIRMLLRNRTASAAAAAVLTAVFMTASVSELSDYRAVSQTNETVARSILDADSTMHLQGQVGILGLNQLYDQDQNYLYHDHVMSAHASDWALTGLVRYYDGRSAIPYVPVPLSVDEEHYSNVWNRETKDVSRFDMLLLYDHDAGTLEPMTLQLSDDGSWLLYDDSAVLRVRVWQDEQGYGNVEIFDLP